MRAGACIPAAALLLTVTTACAGPEPEAAGRAPVRVVVVTHGQSSDPFWSVVSNGVHDAADDLGIRVEYQAPGAFDMVEMSNLIEAAVASRPDGLVVSIPDADALASTICAAAEAGVPVISINSGAEVYQELCVLAHVGQPEYEAGYAAGVRMAEAGVTEALCVNHEVGNLGLDARCEGFADALAVGGGSVEVLAVDLTDPDDMQQRVGGALSARSRLDGILALGPPGAGPTLIALLESGRADDVTLATFDLSPEVVQAVEEGRMLFAIDQQQYLQGYLAVILAAKLVEVGALPVGVIPTGPSFVTAETAAEVMELTERGVR